MCEVCRNALERAEVQGITEAEYLEWIWSCTPFPSGAPTTEQVEALLDGTWRALRDRYTEEEDAAMDRLRPRPTQEAVP